MNPKDLSMQPAGECVDRAHHSSSIPRIGKTPELKVQPGI
jgi:hypothetical protein